MTNRETDVEQVAYQWWRRLNPDTGHQKGHQRAALARMRRASTPIEIMQEPEALRLIERLPRDPHRVAVLAGVLAFVRETDKQRVARAIGRASLDDDQSALLAESRFRRLLQTPPNELLDPMRRLVRMTKGKINVEDLSRAILFWGDRLKKDWIFKYYGINERRDDQDQPGATTTNATN